MYANAIVDPADVKTRFLQGLNAQMGVLEKPLKTGTRVEILIQRLVQVVLW